MHNSLREISHRFGKNTTETFLLRRQRSVQEIKNTLYAMNLELHAFFVRNSNFQKSQAGASLQTDFDLIFNIPLPLFMP